MRTHAGTQHFGAPQRGRSFECNDLLKPKRRRAAQDGADIAGVLHAVQNDGGDVGVICTELGKSTTKPILAGDSKPLMSCHSLSEITTNFYYIFNSY